MFVELKDNHIRHFVCIRTYKLTNVVIYQETYIFNKFYFPLLFEDELEIQLGQSVLLLWLNDERAATAAAANIL